MTLVKKSDLIDESTLILNDLQLNTGSGVFLIEGGEGRVENSIKVYYHRPLRFNNESKVLMVIPGAGRNGDSYRDAWIPESENYNVLILSPMYDEEKYPLEDYHLCGLLKDLNLNEVVEFPEGTNHAILDEKNLIFRINNKRNEWLFNDFDRIFDLVVNSLGSSQPDYDLFGHSAGGQILHRFALFSGSSKANNVFASNSGFYTLPDYETSHSFSKKLTLLIGDQDNESEQGGTLLRSETADKQGLHRLARAQYFYKVAEAKARELNVPLNWVIKIVPDVGHNHELMGDAASRILYDLEEI